MRPMRKLFSILLLFALTLSWATAAVAVYCKHETVPAAQQHIGHHADTFSGHDKNKAKQQPQEKSHVHCSLGSLLSGKILLQQDTVFSNLLIQSAHYFLPPQFPSTVPAREPERPKWSARA
jgi:hypothetical protein